MNAMVATAVKTARCRCKLRYIPKFTAASRGPLCDSTALVIADRAVTQIGYLRHASLTGVRRSVCLFVRL